MKKGLFAIGILFMGIVPSISIAQQQKSLLSKKQYAFISKLLDWQKPSNIFAQKPTAIKERVVGISAYSEFDGRSNVIDSISYIYSGTRGSAYSFSTIAPGYLTHTFDFIHPPNFQVMEPINGSGFINYDSFIYYRSYSEGHLTLSEVCTQEFNESNQTSLFKGYKGSEEVSANFNYDAQGRIVEIDHSNDYGKQWFFYNNDQQIFPSVDSSIDYKSVYTLNAEHKPVHLLGYAVNSSGVWEQTAEGWISYNNAGLLDTVRITEEEDTMAMIVFSYQTGISIPSRFQFYEGDLSQLLEEQVNYFNSSNLPDSMHMFSASEDGPETLTYYFSYNESLNPTKRSMVFDTEDGPVEYIENYYYEQYDDGGTSIANLRDDQPSLICYPNPVGNILYLKLDETNHFGTVRISITDVMGKQVKNAHFSGNEKHIDLTELPAGVYYISAFNKEHNRPITKMIVKQ